MKKTYWIGALALFLLGSCNSHSGHDHEGHTHGSEEVHDHDHEGHDHASENHSGHNHEGEAAHAAEADHAHADHITLCPEKAREAGVVVETIQPQAFRQVIPTSGQVLAAQGDETVVVANVAGVVSFRRPVTEGMAVARGAALLDLSAEHLPQGDPVERARIAYETAKQEYERAARLVESQIVSQKAFNALKETYENARLAYEAIAKNRTRGGVSVTAPQGGYIKTCLVQEGDYVNAVSYTHLTLPTTWPV